MPVFRVETKKRWTTAEWSNRYFVLATDVTGAVTIGENIINVEKAATWNQVQFLGVRVSTIAVDGRTGRTFPANGSIFGAQAMTTPLPMEVRGKVNLFPGVKQPGTKYYSFVFQGGDQVAGALTPDAIARLTTLAGGLLQLGAICDQTGGIYSDISIDARTHIHQMYRAWAARAGADQGD